MVNNRKPQISRVKEATEISAFTEVTRIRREGKEGNRCQKKRQDA